MQTDKRVRELWPDAPGDMTFYSVWEAPCLIHGVIPEGVAARRFIRLPDDVVPHLSDIGKSHADRPTGMRTRVFTDAPAIAVCAKLQPGTPNAESASLRCLSGFDIYLGGAGQRRFTNVTAVPRNGECVATTVCHVNNHNAALRDWMVHFPCYTRVEEVYIGIPNGANIQTPPPYTYTDPVVFYGPSITQGATCTRAGNTYPSVLSRWMNFDYINMGLSGSCLAEPELGHWLSKQKMSVLVYEYEHNAPDPAHLLATHEPFFKIIRAAQPDLPIVMLPRPNNNPDYFYIGEVARRKSIVYRTYENARKAGDQRVWYVDGDDLLAGPDPDACTVDGSHPNDLGYFRMATAIAPALRAALLASVKADAAWDDID